MNEHFVSDGRTPPAAWYALGVLTVVMLFSLVDRQVLQLLAEPIRLKLGLSDLQLGLVQGTGVTLFAAIAGYPLAWLADRFDRRLVLASCVVVWSVAVLCCGLAQTFEQLLLASAMVGAGEAGLIPIAYSLIPQLFAPASRQTANSIFAMAGSAGGSLALIVCGQLIGLAEAVRPSLPAAMASMDGWRLAFFAAATPAPLMVALIATIVSRHRVSTAHRNTRSSLPSVPRPPWGNGSLTTFVARHRAVFISFYIGNGVAVCGFAAVTAWIVVICMRQFAQTPAQVGSALGVVSLIALPIGFVISVYGLRLFSGRLGAVLPIRAIRIALLIVAALYLTLLLATDARHIYGIGLVIYASLVVVSMTYPTVLQSLAPASIRARLIAIQGVVMAICASAGPPLVGFISDRLKDRQNGLLLAAVGVAVTCLFVASILLRWSERGFAAAVQDALTFDLELAQDAHGSPLQMSGQPT